MAILFNILLIKDLLYFRAEVSSLANDFRKMKLYCKKFRLFRHNSRGIKPMATWLVTTACIRSKQLKKTLNDWLSIQQSAFRFQKRIHPGTLRKASFNVKIVPQNSAAPNAWCMLKNNITSCYVIICNRINRSTGSMKFGSESADMINFLKFYKETWRLIIAATG